MPLFKFGYVDPDLRYAEFLFDARVELNLLADHVPDTGIFSFSVSAVPDFEAVQPDYITVPLIEFLFDAEIDNTVGASLDFSISQILFDFASEMSYLRFIL
jgi:hypothetical protein